MKVFFLALILSLPGIMSAQTLQGNEEDLAAILAGIAKFSDDLVAGDYEAVTKAYTDDGKILPGGRDIISGHDGIRSYWKPSNGYRITRHEISPSEIIVEGNTAYDHGYYEGTSVNGEGVKSDFSGKYVIVWRKDAGNWKMYIDIWNRRATKD